MRGERQALALLLPPSLLSSPINLHFSPPFRFTLSLSRSRLPPLLQRYLPWEISTVPFRKRGVPNTDLSISQSYRSGRSVLPALRNLTHGTWCYFYSTTKLLLATDYLLPLLLNRRVSPVSHPSNHQRNKHERSLPYYRTTWNLPLKFLILDFCLI